VNGRRTAADVIRLGQRLLAVKRTLPRGGFHKWLVAEFDNQAETARKAIQAAEVFGDRLPADRSLPIDASAIYVLSKNYVSDTIRAQVIERAKAGVRITHRAVRAMVGGVRQGAARMRRTINIRPTGPFAAQRPKRPPTLLEEIQALTDQLHRPKKKFVHRSDRDPGGKPLPTISEAMAAISGRRGPG
jgi:hypothetical protein